MTIQDVKNKVTAEYKKWSGYTEKGKLSDLNGRSYDNPGNYNEKAGQNNYTVFASLYKEKTGINVQGQPWCDCFVDTILIHLFGVDTAKKLLGGFSAYTPTSAQYFKNMGRWTTTNPEEGAIIFFKNSERINHTGYVYAVDKSYVYTVEGNTSAGANTVVANGGCVAMKKYLRNNTRIAGYGIPDYSICIVNDSYQEGWLRAADGKRWWYQFKDGSYAKNDDKNNGWYVFNNHYFAFDTQGYMLTGSHMINGSRYYFSEADDSTCGMLMTTYGNGYGGLIPWDLSKYPEANMKKLFA